MNYRLLLSLIILLSSSSLYPMQPAQKALEVPRQEHGTVAPLTEDEKYSLLHRAVESESLKELRTALALGIKDYAKNYALGELMRKRNWYLVAVLLKSGVDEDGQEDALFYAIDNELPEFVDLFIANGLSQDLKDEALRRAARKGHLALCEMILATGVSVRGQDCALLRATEAGHTDVATRLVATDVTECAKKLSVRRVLIGNGILRPFCFDDGEIRCALLHAVHEGNVTEIHSIVKLGVSADILGEALLSAVEEGNVEVVNALSLYFKNDSKEKRTALIGTESAVDQTNVPSVDAKEVASKMNALPMRRHDTKTIERYKNKAVRKAVANSDQRMVDTLLALGASKKEAIEAAVEVDDLSTVIAILEQENEYVTKALLHAAEKGSVHAALALICLPPFIVPTSDDGLASSVAELCESEALEKAALARHAGVLELLRGPGLDRAKTNVLVRLANVLTDERNRAWSESVKALVNSGINLTSMDPLLNRAINAKDREFLRLLLSHTIPSEVKVQVLLHVLQSEELETFVAIEELLRSGGISGDIQSSILLQACTGAVSPAAQLHLLEAYLGVGIDLTKLGFFNAAWPQSMMDFIAFCQTQEAKKYRAKRCDHMPTLAGLYGEWQSELYMDTMQNPKRSSPANNPEHPVLGEHAFRLTKHKQTMLTWAVLLDHQECVKALLARPDLQRRFITAPDAKGYSPLCYAAALGNVSLTFDLIRASCIYQFKDKKGKEVERLALEPVLKAAKYALNHGHSALAFRLFNEWILGHKFVIAT